MLNLSRMVSPGGVVGIVHAIELATDPSKARRRLDDGRGIMLMLLAVTNVGRKQWQQQ
jgi:hypothetical protein